MKVLILEGVASPTFGGAEKSMSSFCKYLSGKGDEVFLVCERYDDAYFIPIENALILNLQPFQKQGVLAYIKAVNKVVRFVKEKGVEMMLTHCIHFMPLVRLVKLRTGIPSFIYFKWVFNKPSVGVINSWGLSGFDGYIALNEFIGNYWKMQLRKEVNFQYINDGIDFPKSVDFSRPAYKTGTYKILYFGRIFKGKGLHLLVQAFSKLKGSYKLTVLGDFRPSDSSNREQAYHQEIVNLINTLDLENKIEFKGLVNNVPNYIKEASLVVVPSIIDDAQPFSILESFALGCPAIGTNKGGIPYLYKNDDFWFCEPSVEEIANKIQSILSMPTSELQEKVKVRYNDLYSRYNKLYTEEKLRNYCENYVSSTKESQNK